MTATVDEKRLGILESEMPALDLPNVNAWKYLRPHFQNYGHHTAVVCARTHKSYTYSQMQDAALRWAKEIQGLFQGSNPPVIATILPNMIEYPILYLGGLMIGAPSCPVRDDYDEDLMKHMLEITETSVVVVHSSALVTCRKVLVKLGRKMAVYVLGDSVLKPNEKNISDVLFSDGEKLDEETALQVDPNCYGMITFSSGTTGVPKAILKSQRKLVNCSFCYAQPPMFAARKAQGAFQETLLVTMPLAHSYGLIVIVLTASPLGCRSVICDPFDSSNLIEIMEQYQPGVLKVNPYIIEKLSRITNFGSAFNNVRVITNVGSPHNPEAFLTLNQNTTKSLFLQECYGSSEIGAILSTPIGSEYKPGITGKLLGHTRISVVDLETQQPIREPGKEGELWIQTPWFMEGYLKNPKATAEVFVDGPGGKWYRSGDLGFVTEDGYVRVIERVKDVILVDGKKVLSSKIENLIKTHPSVLDVGVIGHANMKTGCEEPRAFVIRKSPLDEEDIIKFVEEKAPYPEMRLKGGVVFVNDLPRNHLGKMIKKHLRTMVWVEQTQVEKSKNF